MCSPGLQESFSVPSMVDFHTLYAHIARAAIAGLGLFLLRKTKTWTLMTWCWACYLAFLSLVILASGFWEFQREHLDWLPGLWLGRVV